MANPFTITGGILGTDYTIYNLSTFQQTIAFITPGINYIFTPTQSLTQGSYLVVGGGGAGGPLNGGFGAGGGGGGEVSQQSNITFNSLEPYTIFVGEGGLVGTSEQGNPGTPSYISSASLNINCTGGEGGYSYDAPNPGYGGNSYLSNGSYYSGGNGGVAIDTAGGGGAGNGGIGTSGNSYGGFGGIGIISTITGNSVYYSGGGGGGAYYNRIQNPDGSFVYLGQGGDGGGGNGAQYATYNATPGTSNTGGGGGGWDGFGGSGIVILSFFYTPAYPCFKEGSKILTNKGYILIEDLRKGDLVKTLNHGFVPIYLIGKRNIQHLCCKERIKHQLYCCSQDLYPEIFEPLILTGCHSILVDEFVSEEQRTLTEKVNRKIYVTDDKYRLPACVDQRASIYTVPGTYTIYHIALENNDYYMNYGIYANGLLVESCSKRYLKELSDMELIQ